MTAAQRRIFWTLTIANFCLFFGLNVWRSVFNNLAVEELHIEAAQIGFIQSIREVPGLIGFVLGFLALLFTEMTILNLSVVLLGVGLIATGWADQLSTLIIATVVMSIGFHFFVPSSSSMVLMISKKAHAPRALGRLKSVSALAAVAEKPPQGAIDKMLAELLAAKIFFDCNQSNGASAILNGRRDHSSNFVFT